MYDYEEKNMPKISVIVPIYNVEKYLHNCIDSIVNQTLSDIEIILVDDGSTDRSGKICDCYAMEDDRIKVIHKSNEGLACARNDGIKESVAPYIMFVDGDDCVEFNFCEKPYEMAIKYDADLVLFTFNKIRNTGHKTYIRTNLCEGLLNEKEALYFNVHIAPYAWAALYNRDVFKRIEFPAGRYYEDTCVISRIIHFSNTVCLVNQPLYNYRYERSGNITTSLKTKDHIDKRMLLMEKINDLQKWGYYEYGVFYALPLLIEYGRTDAYQVFFDKVARTSKGLPKELTLKLKIMLILYKVSPKMFDFICDISGKRK